MAYEMNSYPPTSPPRPHPPKSSYSSGSEDSGPNRAQQEPLHSPNSQTTSPKTTKVFIRSRQTRSLLLKGCLRWIGTLILTALIAVTLRIYEGKHNFPSDQKTVFNTIITAWILGWGLNLFEACKEAARVVRWRILASEPHTKEEVDLILGIENLLSVSTLGWRSFKKPKILVPCILWILLNLLAQVAVAAVSLTYDVSDGKNFGDTYFTHGMVNASDLTKYFNKNRPLGPEVNQALAHNNGEVALGGRDCEPYRDIAQVLESPNNPPYFCRTTPDKHEFAYRFKEYNYYDRTRAYPSFTNRTIIATSGECFKYNEHNRTLGPDLQGNNAAWHYRFSNSTYNSSISIPISSDGWSATTYIYRGPELPNLAQANSCGDRCVWVWAHQGSLPDNDTSYLFKCPITISKVRNATIDQHHVPDPVSRTAAASIALQGRWSGPEDDKIWTQYQFYAVFTPWETHFQPDYKVGANMAEFALRSIATMAEHNPTVRIPGRVPQLGSSLKVSHHWRYLTILLICIVAGHFTLFVAAIWMAKSVVVADDSFVKVARLLNTVPKESHQSGIEHETATAPHDSEGLVYGPFALDDGGYVLSMSNRIKPLKQWDGGCHPNGIKLDSY